MPCRTPEPRLETDLEYPDSGHWYLQLWFDERLLVRLHVFPTRRGFRKAMEVLAPDEPDVAAVCLRHFRRDDRRARWLVLDLFYCRPVLRQRPGLLWHELTHALQRVQLCPKHLPRFLTAAGKRQSLDECLAMFAAGLFESMRRWWEKLASVKAGKPTRLWERGLAFERLV